jgi:hypothetical protein
MTVGVLTRLFACCVLRCSLRAVRCVLCAALQMDIDLTYTPPADAPRESIGKLMRSVADSVQNEAKSFETAAGALAWFKERVIGTLTGALIKLAFVTSQTPPIFMIPETVLFAAKELGAALKPVVEKVVGTFEFDDDFEKPAKGGDWQRVTPQTIAKTVADTAADVGKAAEVAATTVAAATAKAADPAVKAAGKAVKDTGVIAKKAGDSAKKAINKAGGGVKKAAKQIGDAFADAFD